MLSIILLNCSPICGYVLLGFFMFALFVLLYTRYQDKADEANELQKKQKSTEFFTSIKDEKFIECKILDKQIEKSIIFRDTSYYLIIQVEKKVKKYEVDFESYYKSSIGNCSLKFSKLNDDMWYLNGSLY